MTKLAEYEDAGLAPEEIKDINDILNENNEGTVSEEKLVAVTENLEEKQ